MGIDIDAPKNFLLLGSEDEVAKCGGEKTTHPDSSSRLSMSHIT